jgi:adenine-specific DNA-methyltransferase
VYERTSKSKSVWVGGEISTDVARREFKKLFPEFTTDEYTKSPFFMQRIVQMAAGPNDLVMDFFAGTGTTGQAVVELNASTGMSRRFIGVQFPQPIDPEAEPAKQGYLTSSQIAFERLRRSGGEQGPQPFRAFRLASSSLRRWSGITEKSAEAYEAQLEAFADSLQPGWKAESVIWEVALREGLGLTANVERIGEKTPFFFRVSDEERQKELTICLEETITLDAVKALGLTKDAIFVCRATALDDTLAANLALQCRLKVL